MTNEYKILRQKNPNAAINLYAILMDSDTFFSGAISSSIIWNKYDCIRKNNEDLVLATETSCWIGNSNTTTTTNNNDHYYYDFYLPFSSIYIYIYIWSCMYI